VNSIRLVAGVSVQKDAKLDTETTATSVWRRERLHRRLRQLGYTGDFSKIRMRSWRNSRSPQASFAMPNAWLVELGLFDITSVETGVLPKLT
jgi:hypothetical protein